MRRTSWKNWHGNLRCTARVEEPDSLAALARVVRDGASRGRVRLCGGGYSWSPLVPTQDTLIRMGRLTRCLSFDRDADPPTVRVEAGATIGELTAALRARGLSLISPPMFDRVTVGGAAATGSHGTRMSAGCFADSIASMTLVDASGEVVELDGADAGALRAARVALGAFGVIYAVTLRCEPAFRVSVEQRYHPLEHVLDELDDLTSTYEFAELLWMPGEPDVLVRGLHRTTSPETPELWPSGNLHRLRMGTGVLAGELMMPAIVRLRPDLAPALLRFGRAVMFAEGAWVRAAAREWHHIDAYPRCLDFSCSVPIAATATAFRIIRAAIEEHRSRARFPVNLAAVARFTGPSDAYLAPCEGRPSCFIEVAAVRGTPEFDGFHRELYERLSAAIAGLRPHWGKLLLSPATWRDRFDKLPEFLAERRRFDPDGVFLNEFLEREVFSL
ncbi:L-gulonolactone oxidase [Nannocystis exedens]|uniref:L-gulonolactone oxidase n=1 Tax=Nannocystis exedens TaxID=54 RepID=A0A1I2IHB1_9BACT|nr:D-arabinono-1,4-lactone oxidase [Nannocystis exedens]PCC73657.1 FAD-linked oxidoreductase [Nannocystis exedens]SFF41043.1 L-gulonolactone oxidase [Nannocystis exedens]